MTERQLIKIIQKYDNDQKFIISKAFLDGGIDPLIARLERASASQISNGASALS
jgi:hypothetical protein